MKIIKTIAICGALLLSLMGTNEVLGQTIQWQKKKASGTATHTPVRYATPLEDTSEGLQVRGEEQEYEYENKKGKDDCKCVPASTSLDFVCNDVFDLDLLTINQKIKLRLATSLQIDGVTVLGNEAYAQAEVIKIVRSNSETTPSTIFIQPRKLYTGTQAAPVSLKGDVLQIKSFETVFTPANAYLSASTEVQLCIKVPCCEN